MKRLLLIAVCLVFVSGCAVCNFDPQSSKLTAIGVCKDFDMNDVDYATDPNTGKPTLHIGSISTRTSGFTEGVIGAIGAIFMLAP
jgi:hypothetical protein